MLSNEEIIKRLYEQPDKFMKAMSRKEYANAAFTAYIAECVCLFCDVPGMSELNYLEIGTLNHRLMDCLGAPCDKSK